MCPGHNAYAIVTYIQHILYLEHGVYTEYIHAFHQSISAKSGQVDMAIYLNEVHLGPWSAALC